MLSRLEAYRYKCFRRMAVDVAAYNVLAGPNGSGKTTLLDIPALLGELISARSVADPFLEARPGAAPRAGRLSDLIHRGRGDEFQLAVEAELPPEVRRLTDSDGRTSHLRYEVRFQVLNDTTLEVLNEYLFSFAQKDGAPERGGGLQGEPLSVRRSGRPELRNRRWRSILHRERGEPSQIFDEKDGKSAQLSYRFAATQLALPSIPADQTLFPAALWFCDILRDRTTFFQPEMSALRRAAPPGRSTRLDERGANIARLAFDLQSTRPERFAAWVEHVQTALPRISGITVQEREDDRYVYLQVRYADDYDVPASGLSEGTLRLLALTLLPYLAAPPAVLMTEEPENGIHPRAVETILMSLRSLYDGQVWLSTHSPVVLAATPVSAVLLSVLDESGEATVIAGSDHEKLVEWKGAVDLGTLFAAGVLS